MRLGFLSRAMKAGLCAAAFAFAASLPADAHWTTDGHIVLPDDPVPQIRFHHWYGGDCDRNCALERHCGYDCQIYGYDEEPRVYVDYDRGQDRDRGCDDWRDRDHWAWHRGPCPEDLVEGYLARAKRSDDQSDRWNSAMDHWQGAMDWYDHSVIGRHDHDHDRDHDHDHH